MNFDHFLIFLFLFDDVDASDFRKLLKPISVPGIQKAPEKEKVAEKAPEKVAEKEKPTEKSTPEIPTTIEEKKEAVKANFQEQAAIIAAAEEEKKNSIWKIAAWRQKKSFYCYASSSSLY